MKRISPFWRGFLNAFADASLAMWPAIVLTLALIVWREFSG